MANSSDSGSSTLPSSRATTGRPVGVMLIAALCVLGVLVLLLNLALIVAEPGGFAALFGAEALTLIVSVVMTPLLITGAVGLFRLRPWARVLVVALLGVAIASFFADSLLRYPASTGLLLGLSRSLIPATMLLYLLHPSIRQFFHRGRRG
jgi:hypothetical protein